MTFPSVVSQTADTLIGLFPDDAIAIFDRDFRLLRVGGRGVALLGLDVEAIEGLSVSEVIDAESFSEVKRHFSPVLDGHDSVSTFPLLGRELELRLTPLWHGDRICGGICVAKDVTDIRAAATALHASEELFRQAFRLAPMGVALNSIDGRFLEVNEALCTMTGYPAEALIGQSLYLLTHPDDRDTTAEKLDALLRGDVDRYEHTKRYVTATGETIWVSVSVALLRGQDGRPTRQIAQILDVNDRVLAQQEWTRAQEELATAHAFQEAVLATAPDVIALMDARTQRNIWVSQGLEDLLGYRRSDLTALGKDALPSLIHPVDLERFRAAVRDVTKLADGERVELRHRIRHADGSFRWLQRRMTPFRRDADGSVIEILAVSTDLTTQVEAERALEHRAVHDVLTGLANRTLVLERLHDALEDVGRHEGVSVLFCDLDSFKAVNDGFGHAIGDRVLVEAGNRLMNHLRPGDTVGRMGGDEFVIVMRDTRSQQRDHANAIASRILRELARPFVIDGVKHSLTISIGICFGGFGALPDALLSQADAAMYQAKAAGKNRAITCKEPDVLLLGDPDPDPVSA